MDEFVDWHRKQTMKDTAKSLEENGFTAFCVPDSFAAKQKILELVPEKSTVGIPGSATLQEIGILQALKERGDKVLYHGEAGLSTDEKRSIQRQVLTADVFLSGSNAVTKDGKLVNIDGVGNRVAALSFGPKKTIVVTGYNKIVADLDAGLQRIRDIAAPINAKRLSLQTPCAATGYCVDCDSPQRICNIINVIAKKSKAADITVILVDQDLGY